MDIDARTANARRRSHRAQRQTGPPAPLRSSAGAALSWSRYGVARRREPVGKFSGVQAVTLGHFVDRIADAASRCAQFEYGLQIRGFDGAGGPSCKQQLAVPEAKRSSLVERCELVPIRRVIGHPGIVASRPPPVDLRPCPVVTTGLVPQ